MRKYRRKWRGPFIAMGLGLSLSASVALAAPLTCDVDGDGDVDRNDINAVFAARGTTAQSGDPRDADGDGIITVNDGRFCVLQCTLPRCAIPPADTTPPLVTIATPANLSFFNNSPITVTGEVSEVAGVTVNGVPATVSDGTFTATGVPLQEGANTVTATATDAAGNVGTASIQVSLDTTPPQLNISTPPNNAVLVEPRVRVAGTIDDSAAKVNVNGQAATVSDGQWEVAQLTLDLGQNTITVVAADVAGNSSEQSLQVTRKLPNQIPTADPGGPYSGSVGQPVVFDGGGSTDPDNDPLTFAWEFGDGSTGTGATPSHTYGTVGTFTVTLTVDDGRGGTKTAATTVTVLNRPPEITSQPVTEARDNLAYQYQLEANDPDGDSLTFALTQSPSGMTIDSTSGLITWTPSGAQIGTHQVSVVVSDTKGSSDTQSFEIAVKDVTLPVVTLTGPREVLPGSQVTVMAQASDNVAVASVTFEVNGTDPSEDKSPPYQRVIAVPPVASVGDTIRVQATARDSSGNIGSAEATLTIVAQPDTENPEITLNLPSGAAPGTTIHLSATARDNVGVASVAFSADGVPILEDTEPPYGATFQIPSDTPVDSSLAFSAQAVDYSGNAAAASGTVTIVQAPDTTPPTVELAAPAEIVAGGTLSLAATATDDVGVASVSFFVDNVLVITDTDAPYEATFPLLQGTLPGALLQVEARAIDFSGLEASDSGETLVIAPPTPARGVIAGEVYDETSGLPIEGAIIQLVSLDGEPPNPVVLKLVSDARGRFRVGSTTGIARIRIVKPGFTEADRVVQVVDGKRTDPIDARLTPLDANEATLSSVVGGTVSNQDGDLELTIPPGALSEDQTIRLTRVSPQGLVGQLPLGWSPVAGVDIFPGDLSFGSAASVSVATPAGLAEDAQLLVARWDDTTGSWIAEGNAGRSPDGKHLEFNLTRAGQYAFLLADPPPVNPPSPIVGQAIPGLLANPPPDSVTAFITPSPRILFAQPGAHSRVGVLITPPSRMPSGTPLQADLQETFNFVDGTRLYPNPAAQDLTLYAFPAGGGPLTLRSEFTVTPSRAFESHALQLGVIDVGVRLPLDPGAPRGTVIGPEGGTAEATSGERVVIPAGATAEDLPVVLSALPQEQFPAAIPDGLTFVGAVTLDLHGGALNLPASLSIPAPSGLSSADQVLVVQLVEAEGTSHLALVGLGVVQGSDLVGVTDPRGDGTLLFPGIRSEGRYAFLRADPPLGFVTGTVSGDDGLPVPGALVTLDILSIVSLTDAEGRYVLASPTGDIQVTATDPDTKDIATRSETVVTPEEVLPLALSLSTTPPSVVSVTPADGAQDVPLATVITVAFSEPVDPNSVTQDSVLLSDGAALVPSTVSLSPDQQVLTLRPNALLADQTTHQLTVAATIKDLTGNPIGTPFASQFTTVDLTPPPPPPAGSIAATIPDDTGATTVSATQGTVDPDGTAVVKNLTTGALTTLTPNTDGSFSGTVPASPADQLELIIRDKAGNETKVALPRFENPDGSVVVGSEGGRVDGAGGVFVDVPPGALPDGTVVKVDPVMAAELDLPAPVDFPFTGGVRLDLGGVRPLEPVDLGIEAPPDATAQDQVLVARTVELPSGPAWTVVDRAHLEDDRYVTASPPFEGVLGEGSYSFLKSELGCISYVHVRYQFRARFFLLPTGIPFVFPTVESETATIPAVCDSQLEVQVVSPSLGEVLDEISVAAPVTPDDVAFFPGILSDDELPPIIAETNTFSGQLLGQIEIRFSEPMDEASVQASFAITDSLGFAVPGGLDLRENRTLALFRPDVPFRLGERYVVTLDGATDAAGNELVAPPIVFTLFDPSAADQSVASLGEPPPLCDDPAEATNPRCLLSRALRKCAGSVCTTSARDATRLGDVLFLANGLFSADHQYEDPSNPTGLVVADVSDPQEPVLIGSRATTTNPKAVAAVANATFGDFAGDLLLVAGGGRVALGELDGKLEIYDVGACTSGANVSNCLDADAAPLKGVKLLSTASGTPPRPGVPPEWGIPLQIATLHEKRSGEDDVVLAYVIVSAVGLEAVDVTKAFNVPLTPESNRAPDGLVRGDFLDVALLKNRVLTVEHDLTTASYSLALFSAQLQRLTSIALPGPASRVVGLENFVIDVDGDGNLGDAEQNDGDEVDALDEIFDFALVAVGPRTEGCFTTAPCGELLVVDLSHHTNLGHESGLGLFSTIPLPGPAFSVQVDPEAALAYVEMRGHGLAVVDLSHLRAGVANAAPTQGLIDANGDGRDERLLAVVPKTDIFMGEIEVDLERGLAFVNGSVSGPEILRISIDCNELALDFGDDSEEPPPTDDDAFRDEKLLLAALLELVAEELEADGIANPVFLEQGSGACFWREEFEERPAATCRTFQPGPGRSDHDIEVLVPQAQVADAQAIMDDFLDLAGRDPESPLHELGELSLFAVSREAFESAELPVSPPQNEEGDTSGDLGLGRQLLLLLWLLDGEYVTGHQGDAPSLDAVLATLKGRTDVVPGEPPIPRLEGFEWSLLQEFNLHKTGAMLRIAGACDQLGVFTSVSPDVFDELGVTDPARNFEERDALFKRCQEQLRTVAKAGIRAVMARLVADEQANALVLDIDRARFRANGCRTGVADPRFPPPDVDGYTPKSCSSFEEYVVDVAVRSIEADLGIFSKDELPLIFSFFCAKLGPACHDRSDRPIGKPLFTTDEAANRFIADTLAFIERMKEETEQIYSDTVLADTKPIGNVPFLGEIAAVCADFGIPIDADTERSALRRCNRESVLEQLDGQPGLAMPTGVPVELVLDRQLRRDLPKALGVRHHALIPHQVRAINKGQNLVSARLRMYEGPGPTSEYRVLRTVDVDDLKGGEKRVIAVEDDPELLGARRPVFPTLYVFDEIALNESRSIAYYLDPDHDNPEADRRDNFAGFFYYRLDPANPDPPELPEAPELPVDDDVLEPNPECPQPPLLDFELVSREAGDTSGGGSGIITITVGQSAILTYRARNRDDEVLPKVEIYVPGQLEPILAEDDVPPGETVTAEGLFHPGGTGTFTQSAIVLVKDPFGNVRESFFDSVTIHVVPPGCDAAILPLSPDPNPFDEIGLPLSTVMEAGKVFRYFQVRDRRNLPVAGATVRGTVTHLGLGVSEQIAFETDEDGVLVHEPIDDQESDTRGVVLDLDDFFVAPGESLRVDLDRVDGYEDVCDQLFFVDAEHREFTRSWAAGRNIAVEAAVEIGIRGEGGRGISASIRELAGLGRQDLTFGMSQSSGVGVVLTLLDFARARAAIGLKFQAGLGASISGDLLLLTGNEHEFPFPAGSAMLGPAEARALGAILPIAFLQTGNPVLDRLITAIPDQLEQIRQFQTGSSTGVGVRVSADGSAGGTVGFLKNKTNLLAGLQLAFTGSASEEAILSLDERPRDMGWVVDLEGRAEEAFGPALTAGIVQEEDDPETQQTKLKFVEKITESLSGGNSESRKLSLELDEMGQPVELKLSASGTKNFGFKLGAGGEDLQLVGGGAIDNQDTMAYTITNPAVIREALKRAGAGALEVAGQAAALLAGPQSPVPLLLETGPPQFTDLFLVLIDLAKERGATYQRSRKEGSGASLSVPIGGKLAGISLQATPSVKFDHSIDFALERGAAVGGEHFKLELYENDGLVPPPTLADIEDLFTLAVDALVEFTAPTFDLVQQTVESGINFIDSLFSAHLEIDGTLEQFELELISFHFEEVDDPIPPSIHRPWNTLGPAGDPHYGVGSFHQFTPDGKVLATPAQLTITYDDEELAGADESTLAIYRWNADAEDWDHLGGAVDAAGNAVTTSIDRLGLYTAAPALPSGAIGFTAVASPGAGPLDATTLVTYTSDPIGRNDGSAVPDGTVFHVHVIVPDRDFLLPAGEFLSPDADPDLEGHQVVSEGGRIEFSLELPGKQGQVRVIAFSEVGTALGDEVIPYQQ